MKTNLISILNRRVERLNEEYKMNAPQVIINTEIRLIVEVCLKLLKLAEN